jgi:hypothetical protein
MYSYHGWLFTHETISIPDVRLTLENLNRQYPVSISHVNGSVHISFSGNPNRDLGELEKVIDYLVGLKKYMTGCVYINDANSNRALEFDVVKIVNDRVTRINDKNFSRDETFEVFK